MIHVAQRRIRDAQSVLGIDHIKRFPPLPLQLLIGAYDQAFIVDHGIVFPVQEHIHQPFGAAGTSVNAGKQAADFLLQGLILQIRFAQCALSAGQRIQKADIGARAGIGLRGAGHAECHLSTLDGLQNVRHLRLSIRKPELLRQAFPDAEHHRRGGNRLGMLDQMLRIPQGNPQTAGRPDRIVILRSCLQRPHDINGALIGDLNIDPGFLHAVLKNLLQLPVFRTGKDPHRFSRSEGGKRRGFSIVSLLPSSGACRNTAVQEGQQKQKSQK